ncbi:MAG: type II toxin-antitoxin system RelE/ParE family toxin [Sphingomonas sp.]|nr:type II toxin-antitoxin system RelE/ParE family toxin [Sphingomonas sp.]
MAWQIEFADRAAKQLRKLDPLVAKRILTFLRDRVAPLDDPPSIGEALRGNEPGDFWKYRVGDWRIIADLDDGVLLITVVRLGNRRDVYRRRSSRSGNRPDRSPSAWIFSFRQPDVRRASLWWRDLGRRQAALPEKLSSNDPQRIGKQVL